MNLYKACSKLNIYYDLAWRYSHVDAFWARDDGLLPERLNGKYIKDYEPGCDGEQAISELFTFEEAKRLRRWLQTNGEDCIIEAVSLPIAKDTCPRTNLIYGDLGSCAIFMLPGLPATKLNVYSNFQTMSYEDRVPMAQDFVIGSAYNVDGKCFYCKKGISDETHYRVLVILGLEDDKRGYWWMYDSLCDDCSLAHAPELYLTLKALGMPEMDPTYLPRSAIKHSFGIKFPPDYLKDEAPCPICDQSTPLLFPFSILGLNGDKVRSQRLCKKCADIHVPKLLQIVKQFYASGADQKFLKRYEQERTSMEYGIFKNKILYRRD